MKTWQPALIGVFVLALSGWSGWFLYLLHKEGQAAHREKECQEWTELARDLGERLQTVDAGLELWKLKCIAKGLK